METSPLYLKKHQERRLRGGHCWVYSNEIDTARSPIKGYQAGDPVEVLDHQGKWLGHGYINPHTLLAVRLASRDRAHPLDGSLLVHRLKIALGLRERLFDAPCYRLLFGESDGLPGLVVDRFGDVVSLQITTAGMERHKEAIIAALDKVLKPKGMVLRNDTPARELEGLDRYVEAVGQVPERVELSEHGMPFETSLHEGQKTGWFYDQAANRQRMHRHAAGKRVLDLFSYAGAWGVQAAVKGASEVLCVDASPAALESVTANAERNGVAERVAVEQGDVFEVMKALRQEQRKFDLVLVDPPAFVKKRKDFKQGAIAYRRLNQLALQLVEKDGMVITSSCSHHMSEESLLNECQQAARHTDRFIQLLEKGQQGPDHPVHPAIPETAYLKSFYLRVLGSF